MLLSYATRRRTPAGPHPPGSIAADLECMFSEATAAQEAPRCRQHRGRLGPFAGEGLDSVDSKDYFRNMTFISDPDGPVPLEDPRAMRALAHPVRLAILDFLRTAGAATATQCAEAVGESPSACSYHLRTLAKWGFVAEAEGDDRRERPWKHVSRRFAWSSETATTPDQLSAGRAILDATLARDNRIVATFLEHEERVATPWRETATFIGATLYMTPEEITELTQQVQRLIEPYTRDQPDQRPDGAGSVRVVFRTVPLIRELLGDRAGSSEDNAPPS
jgi:DNA-binding transcriptional ArsR family regulator